MPETAGMVNSDGPRMRRCGPMESSTPENLLCVRLIVTRHETVDCKVYTNISTYILKEPKHGTRLERSRSNK